MNDIFDTIDGEMFYRVPTPNKPVSGTVTVPGSKSITNRALLIAALAEGTTHLEGVLFSDDSRHFLSSLQSLGFNVTINEPEKKVTVVGLGGRMPSKKGTVHVGSAGTAARFLTSMLALSEGEFVINCSRQMAKRPMKPLFDALTSMGAKFQYLGEDYFLPAKVKGTGTPGSNVSIDITKSTQFLSALLMVSPMTGHGLNIRITSEKKEGSYVRITTNMMAAFGVDATFAGDTYTVREHQRYKAMSYAIEPDVSAACYFYAAAAITGGSITVRGVKDGLMQGDMKFLGVLKELGATLTNTKEGIQLTGPTDGIYNGIEADLNNFSDQTMTLASVATYATCPTVIRNVAHIRVQECDRMQAIVNELTRIGIKVEADGENIHITPGPIGPAYIQTYDDHRMAMAFSLLGLKTEGIVITDPKCCRKTFENYFEVFDALVRK